MPSEQPTEQQLQDAVEDLAQQEGPRPLTAEEILKHPEFPYVNWILPPQRKERVIVGRGRGGPFRVCYEIHGKGPIRTVWIMGLGGTKNAWQRQTKDFGHTDGDQFSCLVYDNRGIGESDKPLMRYSTSEMARDLIEVLDHVGWTGKRELHVTGISMGGMIAQELGLRIPKRIASLNLISTGPRIKNTVGFMENLYNRAMLFIPQHVDALLAGIKYNLYSDDFLHHPDQLEYTHSPYPTNGDRCMAYELYKRLDPAIFPRQGFILQAIAAGWHHKTPSQLRALSKLVGPERIMVVHGTRDRMVTFPHGQELAAGLGGEEAGITQRFIEGQGHVIPIELRKEFGEWIRERIDATRGMGMNGYVEKKA